MNKVLNINLGGYAITIDDDAHQYLEAYLDNIENRFRDSEGRREIMEDIERRMGEIITSNLGSRSIVMLPDVESAVEVMGKPEDFGDEPSETADAKGTGRPAGSSSTPGAPPLIKTGKKLFRDPQDKVVGGVCSGLSAYFGITDSVWLRILFVVLAVVSAGFWVPAYILLMIIVPEAKTAADRLAMRGEPANVDNIAREVKEGFERFYKNVNDPKASKEFGERVDRKAREFAERVQSNSNGCGALIGSLFTGFIILVVVSMILGLGLAWTGSVWAFAMAGPSLTLFSPLSSGLTYLAVFNIFFLIGLPLIGLCIWLARTAFKLKVPTWIRSGIGVLWVLNFISFILIGAAGGKQFRRSGTISKVQDLTGMTSDTLNISHASFTGPEGESLFHIGPDDNYLVGLREGNLEFKDLVSIRVRRSTTGQFECTQQITARGATRDEAQRNAEQTNFNLAREGNTLRVPTRFSLQKGEKWRVQRIRLVIGVPVGKAVTFDDKIYRLAAADMDEYADSDDRNYISKSPGKIFQMTAAGLRCADCPTFGDPKYDGDSRNYEDFIVEGDFDVELQQGDNFTLSVNGDPEARKLVEVRRSGGRLTLTSNGKSVGNKVRVLIETPVFTSLIADNAGNIVLRGFDEGTASITAKKTARIKGYFDVKDLDVTLSGSGCQLDLTGRGKDLKASLSDGAVFEAQAFRTGEARVYASGGSKARIYVRDDAKVEADASSDVKVERN
jgi:phage shock protein PspC (stress-responsive transcriptional regulator)